MSDMGTGGGGAPAPSGGVPAPAAAPKGGAPPPPAAKGASPPPAPGGTGAGTPPADPVAAPRKYKVMAGGKEHEWTEEEVLRRASSGYAVSESLKQAKEMRAEAAREANEARALTAALKDPRHFREIARAAGLDEDALYEEMRASREEAARMTPEQRSAAEDRRIAQEARAMREREEGALREQQMVRATQTYQAAITRTANGLLAEAGFKARSPEEAGSMLANVAGKLALMAEYNVDEQGRQRQLTKGHVREAVRIVMEERTGFRSAALAEEMSALEALEDAALAQRLPPKLIERIARIATTQAAAPAVAKPVGKPTNGTPQRAPDGRFAPEREMSFKERMRQANEKWKNAK